MASINKSQISAVILAGGISKRMYQQDKGLILLNKKPLIEYAIKAITPYVKTVFISANRNIAQYQKFSSEPIISDDFSDFQGPLAGFAKAMSVVKTPYLLILPCDCPSLGGELVVSLADKLSKENAEICFAHDGNRAQPMFVLLKSNLLASLKSYLDAGNRKIILWYQNHRTVFADFSSNKNFFNNLNKPSDFASLTKPQKIGQTPILGVAAFSGVGKTTLLSKVIKTMANLQVTAIKKSHHNFTIDYPGKDSYKFFQAGAQQVLISSSDKFALIARKQKPDNDLFELLKTIDLSKSDLVLVEGFKNAPIAKIELQRTDLKHPNIFPEDSNIIAVASDQPKQVKACNRIVLDINNPDEIADFITAYCSN